MIGSLCRAGKLQGSLPTEQLALNHTVNQGS